MTPEGKVKVRVKAIIKSYKPHVYSHWPVLNGMGEPTLDCNGSVGGEAFSVETKKEGAGLTMRQMRTKADMENGGVTVFVIVGRDDLALAEFDAWLRERVIRWLDKLEKGGGSPWPKQRET